jgi:hypothetical protein
MPILLLMLFLLGNATGPSLWSMESMVYLGNNAVFIDKEEDPQDTPLHAAVKTNDKNFLDKVSLYTPGLLVANNKEETPIDIAVRLKNIDVIKKLAPFYSPQKLSAILNKYLKRHKFYEYPLDKGVLTYLLYAGARPETTSYYDIIWAFGPTWGPAIITALKQTHTKKVRVFISKWLSEPAGAHKWSQFYTYGVDKNPDKDRLSSPDFKKSPFYVAYEDKISVMPENVEQPVHFSPIHHKKLLITTLFLGASSLIYWNYLKELPAAQKGKDL